MAMTFPPLPTRSALEKQLRKTRVTKIQLDGFERKAELHAYEVDSWFNYAKRNFGDCALFIEGVCYYAGALPEDRIREKETFPSLPTLPK